MRLPGIGELPDPPERVLWYPAAGQFGQTYVIGSDGAFRHWSEDPDVWPALTVSPHREGGKHSGRWLGWNRYLTGQ